MTIHALYANAQEGHLIALHAVCRAFDARWAAGAAADRTQGSRP